MNPKSFRIRITRLLKLFTLLTGILFIVPQTSQGQYKKPSNVLPDQEIRSSIHSVDGYAYLSENMTLSDTRAAAFGEAKRKALEMAQTYIKSKTKIEDFVAKYDLIWAEAEGSVKILEQKDLGIKDNIRYHVWIKAEVEYKIHPQKDPHDELMGTGLPLKVKVWTPSKHYRQGDKIEIFIQGNRDFYARIVAINSSGEIVQLLPNKYRKIHSFKAGEIYKIPDMDDHFNLKVKEPFGEDNIVVYASEVPLGRVSTESIENGLSLYRGSRESFASETRGIEVVSEESKPETGVEYYEATWSITTSE